MSFGFSVADFAALGQLAWKIYKACKDAPDSFKNISQEVSSLHLVLKEVEETLSDSALSAPQQSRLDSVGDGCRVVLEDLQFSLDKYNSLGTKSKRTWDRLGWGSKDIAELRSRLISNTVMLTTLVNTSQINIQKKLDIFKKEYRDGKHEGSIVSTQTVESLSADEQQAWRAIRKELEDIGISVEAFDANKDFILNWFKTAISTGALEEQTLEAETSSLLDEDDLSQVDINMRDDHGMTPLHHATEAKIEEKTKGDGSTALHQAAVSGDQKKVELLLNHGAKIEEKDNNNGYTALHWAAGGGRGKVMKLLLNHGARIEEKDNNGHTALHQAASRGWDNIEVVKLLLNHGAKIEEKDNMGSTALHQASTGCGNVEVVKLLLNHGAKIEEKDNMGFTALHQASTGWSNVEVVKVLLNHRAKIEEKDNNGYTALHWAASSRKKEVVQLLLNHGAKIEEKDNNNDIIREVLQLPDLVLRPVSPV
ncbi:hypothetical protein MMC07_007700 [Pseudocyphellaria aurata]|nr:hypothetical protein [Pseudocyphellaria aurata]